MKTHLTFRTAALLTVAAALCIASPAATARGPHFLIRDLGTLSGAIEMTANSINYFGDVVGEANSNGYVRPFLYSRGELSQLPVGELGSALDISDSGHIVGYALSTNGAYAFLYQNGRLTDLTAATGQPIELAQKVNNRGTVVGSIRSEGLINIKGVA
jgi:probable HAF family extracellular repeat protein